MKGCSYEDCGEKHYAKGFCKTHYDGLPERRGKRAASQRAWENQTRRWVKKARTPRRRFTVAKGVARRKKRTWNISFEAFVILIGLPCHYCGGKLNETGCGLDRQDNRLGYEMGNVVSCCADCNFKKGCLEAAGFIYPRILDLMKELICREHAKE